MNVPAEPTRKSRTDTEPRHGILVKTTPADLGLVQLPALTPHLQFHDLDEQQTLLVSESFNTLLHGKLYSNLLPLLDGRRPQDEIVAGPLRAPMPPPMFLRQLFRSPPGAMSSLQIMAWTVAGLPTGRRWVHRLAGSNNGSRNRASRLKETTAG